MLSDEELDDLLSLAGETRPVSRAALNDESVRYALDDAWHRTKSNAARREAPRRARRPVRWRELAGAGIAAVVVGVASLFVAQGLKGGAGSAGFSLAVSPAAAAQLNRVAYVAAAQPGLSAGQWQYVERTSRGRCQQLCGGAGAGLVCGKRGRARARVARRGGHGRPRVHEPESGVRADSGREPGQAAERRANAAVGHRRVDVASRPALPRWCRCR